MAYDLLIKNGRIVDGSGGPSFHGDIAVLMVTFKCKRPSVAQMQEAVARTEAAARAKEAKKPKPAMV